MRGKMRQPVDLLDAHRNTGEGGGHVSQQSALGRVSMHDIRLYGAQNAPDSYEGNRVAQWIDPARHADIVSTDIIHGADRLECAIVGRNRLHVESARLQISDLPVQKTKCPRYGSNVNYLGFSGATADGDASHRLHPAVLHGVTQHGTLVPRTSLSTVSAALLLASGSGEFRRAQIAPERLTIPDAATTAAFAQ